MIVIKKTISESWFLFLFHQVTVYIIFSVESQFSRYVVVFVVDQI